MAIGVEHLRLSQTRCIGEPTDNTLIQRLVDEGAVYVPQAFTTPQFATLSALFHRLPCPAKENPAYIAASLDRDLIGGGGVSRNATYPLGLDELDSLSRTRAGYAFDELTPEIQDAMLELVATGDLVSGRLNLALWLEGLRGWAANSSFAAQ